MLSMIQIQEKSSPLISCSIIVEPARKLVFRRIRTWLDQVVQIIVHTFVVDGNKVPIDPNNPDGYWYCAGDFCAINEAGAYQNLSNGSVVYAECLVAPNIKDNDVDRPEKVISGEYGVHYVCHNITNRVLYATDNKDTLIDLDIPITGYEVVVKSALGIYGQNNFEWHNRIRDCNEIYCSNELDHDGLPLNDRNIGKPSTDTSVRSRKEEIAKIHLRASDKNESKAKQLTSALNEIDTNYLCKTRNCIAEYNQEEINLDTFNIKMIDATNKLFSSTIETVGFEVAQRIYPKCQLNVEENVEITESLKAR